MSWFPSASLRIFGSVFGAELLGRSRLVDELTGSWSAQIKFAIQESVQIVESAIRRGFFFICKLVSVSYVESYRFAC